MLERVVRIDNIRAIGLHPQRFVFVQMLGSLGFLKESRLARCRRRPVHTRPISEPLRHICGGSSLGGFWLWIVERGVWGENIGRELVLHLNFVLVRLHIHYIFEIMNTEYMPFYAYKNGKAEKTGCEG